MDIVAIIRRNAWMDTSMAEAFRRAACIRRVARECEPSPEDEEDADLRACRRQSHGVTYGI